MKERRRFDFVRVRTSVLLCAGALLLTVCGEPGGPTGPGGEMAGARASFSFAPSFPENATQALHAAALDVDNVHITIKRLDGSVALDTVVAFPVGVDEVTLNATLILRTASEQFSVLLQLRSGTTALFEGTQAIDAKAGVTGAQPIAVTTHFVGPGATAAKVTINPRTVPLGPGATAQLTAVVTDASGAAIAGVPATWTSSDPSVATVSATGLVTSLNKRGTSSISIKILSGLTDAVPATVTLPPSAIRVVSGSGQSGRAGDALAQPLVVEVDAADGVGVAGVTVNFRGLATAASVSPASVVTDANGRASTTMTLGSQASAQTFDATAGSLNVSTTATATPAAPSQLAIVSGSGQSDTTGKPLAQPFVVLASDRFGNPVSDVSVTWQRVSGGGATAAATSTTGANGQATMTYTLGAQPGPETVSATITGAAAVTFTANAIARPPVAIVATTATTFTGTVGNAVGALGVKVTNSLGAPVAGVTVTWSVAGTATIGTPSTTTGTDGTAVNTFTFGTTTGISTISASFSGGPPLQFKITATAGAAAQLLIVSGNNQSANAGANVAIAPSVRLVDQFNNPVSGSVAFAATTGGGSVTGSPATTDATGLATLGSWTLGPAGPQTLTASYNAINVVFNATSVSAGPPQLAVTQQPGATVVNGAVFAAQPQVQLKDNAGAPLALANVPVTVALVNAGQALSGTLTVNTNGSGLAVFTGLSILGNVGPNSMQFTSNGYTLATSTTFTVTAGAPTQLAAVTTQSLSGSVGAVAAPNPQVVLKDVSGNPVPGQTVTFAAASATSGTVVGGSAVTNASGVASPTSWTFDNAVGKDTLLATFASVSGSPVMFEATVVSGAATQLVIISGNNQTGVTGQPLGAPLVVEARDALNNPVASFGVAFQTTGGGGTPTTATASTAANGQASFTWTMGPPGAQNSRVCLLPNCTGAVFFSALSIPVGTDATWTGAVSTDWGTSGNWSPAAVPSTTSNVFVPAGTPNAPALSYETSVKDVTLASGVNMTMGVYRLFVLGSLRASGATLTGTDDVVMAQSTTAQLAAVAMPGLIVSGPNVTITGNTQINGRIEVESGGSLDIGASTVVATGRLRVTGGARLRMTNASARLTVSGEAFFDGSDMGNNDLTAGQLDLKGNFIAAADYYQSYRATGTHSTRFVGTVPQTISMAYPDAGVAHSQFANVVFSNPAGVTLATDVYASVVSVIGATAITGGRINVGQSLSSASGSSLAGVPVVGVYEAGGTFPSFGGTPPAALNFGSGSTITVPSNSFPGDVDVNNGTILDIGASTVTFGGSLTYSTGARLRMNNAAGRLTVNGNATFNATDMGDGDLTAGTLEIRGNFTAGAGYYQAFRASGSHLTKFTGSSPQTISMAYGDNDAHTRFQNLDLLNAAGISFAAAVAARGNVNVSSATAVTGGRLYVGGLLTSPAGSSLSGIQDVYVYAGTSFPNVTGAAPPMTYLNTGTTVVAPSATYAGAVTVAGATTLDMASSALTINGSLTYTTGARLRMNNAGGYLLVKGDASFNGNDMGNGDLTAGTLEIRGNFSAGSGYYQAFRATDAHLTRFTGTTTQSISMVYPNDAQTRFENVELSNAAGITLSTPVMAHGSVSVLGTTSLSGGRLYTGPLTTAAGTSLAGLSDAFVYAGTVFPQILGAGPPRTYLGTGTTVPAFNGTLPSSLSVVDGAIVDVGTSQLNVNGALDFATGARLRMNDAAGKLVVNGNATFNGNDMGDGDLTAGTLEIKGNFSAGSAYYQAFRAGAGHTTKFTGTTQQLLSITYPSDAQSRLGSVVFNNTVEVALTTTTIANGDVTVAGTTSIRGDPLYVAGAVSSASGTSMAGLQKVIVYGGSAFPTIAGVAPPVIYLTGTGTFAAPTGTYNGNLAVGGGATLDIGSASLLVTGTFSMVPDFGGFSHLKMTTASAHLTINGDALFNGGDLGDADLTNGVLELKGNFQAGSAYYQAFRAVGSHLTKFSGAGAQTLSTSYPAESQSKFQNILFANTSASGVTNTNATQVSGNVTQNGRLAVPASTYFNIVGALTLGGSSTTTVQGSLTYGSCGAAAGASYSGFTCSLGGSESKSLLAPVKKADR